MATQSVIIEGNAFDDIYGGGAGYYYDELILVNAQSKIENNQLNASPSNNLVTVTASSIVSNNYFNSKSGIGAKHLVVTAPSRILNNTFASAATTYSMDVSANSTIVGNIFEKASPSTTIMNLTNCQCSVHHNKFYRGAVSINYYVKINGTSGHQITDNFFDGYTVDGTTETVVGTATSADNVSSNKNQIAYMSTMASDHTYGGLHMTNFGPTRQLNTFLYNNVATITSTTGVGLANYTGLHFINLSRILPPKARLLGVLTGMGWSTIAANVTGAGMSFTMGLFKTDPAYPITNTFSIPVSTLASKGLNSTLVDASPISPQTASVAGTLDLNVKYLSADYTGFNIYNDGTNDLILRLIANYQVSTTSATSSYTVSPILIRYTY